MRKIRRCDLSTETMDFLWQRRLLVVEAGAQSPGEREKVQYEEANRLWGFKRNKAFDEIRERLRSYMAPGEGGCMYCEYTLGDAIDHYRPMEKYPSRAFEWNNYLWSCTTCNTHFKGTQFPLDENGLPLLIDPTREDPRDHLELSPGTGKLTARTQMGSATIAVLGFERRGGLDIVRARAWRGVQSLLLGLDEAFAREDWSHVDEYRADLSSDPLASLLALLIQYLDNPDTASLVKEPRCASILARHPAIRSWVQTKEEQTATTSRR